jgi:hypothetical protein
LFLNLVSTFRLTALRLLLRICKECSDSVVAEHGVSYIQQVARLCEKHNNVNMRCLSLLILSKFSHSNKLLGPVSVPSSITGDYIVPNKCSNILHLTFSGELSMRADKFPNMSKSITGFALTQIVDCLKDASSMVTKTRH